MAGKSRLFRPNFISIASVLAAASMIAPVSNAQSRKSAPITYAGQGGFKSASQENRSGSLVKRGAPIRFSGSVNRTKQPAYSQPVYAQSDSPRTKRIEFRYPDQPHMVHSKPKNSKVKTSVTADQLQTFNHPTRSGKPRQYAAVGEPKRITPEKMNAPVLHQPNYTKPVIREAAIRDVIEQTSASASAGKFNPMPTQRSVQQGFSEQGLASWYGDEFHGQPTANGELFDKAALTAAHPTLPLPSLVQVVNLKNKREIVVRVNDRGPFVSGRMIDVSKQAADALGFLHENEAKVEIRYLGPAPIVPQKAVGQVTPPSTKAQITDIKSQAAEALISYPQPKMDPIPNPSDSAYYIQAGSFSQIENAQRFRADLGGGVPVDVVMANVRGSDFFRVLVGPYDSRADASEIQDRLFATNNVRGLIIKSE